MKKTMLFIVIAFSSFMKLSAQCITVGAHDTDFVAAHHLISNYISAKDNSNAHYYLKGGYFEIPKSFFTKKISTKNLQCGFLVWFLEKAGRFYSACEQVIIPDSANPRDYVDRNKTNYENFANIRFTSEIENTVAQLNEFNRQPANNYRITSSTQITGEEILTENTSYLSKFGNMVYAAGFYHTDNINALIGQADCIGIRIYWGYETGNSAPVRMIAFGIDSKGRNIFSGRHDQKDLILEQSWPPFDPIKH